MSKKLLIAIQSQITVSRQLRVIEYRAMNHAQLMRIRTRLATTGIPERSIARIMKTASRARIVKLLPSGKDRIKSPIDGKNDTFAIHANIDVPDPSWVDETISMSEKAHMDRTIYLRRELRAAHLAYNFLRGTSIESVEDKGYEPIPFARIEQIAHQYCEGKMPDFDAWKADALGRKRHPVEHTFDVKSKTDMERMHARNDKSTLSTYSTVF